MRDYNNHKMILEAVEAVRAELKNHSEQGGANIEANKILERLVSLYALIDVTDLKNALTELEGIDQRRAQTLPRYKRAA